MQEEWQDVVFFPGYSVSNHGQVRNNDTGYILQLRPNQSGVYMVSMNKRKTQYRRSITLLVASTFLEPHKEEAFNTPINLDGDRLNNRVDNLMWRPRFFASRYFKQFPNQGVGFAKPIQDMKTGEEFDTSWEAAIKYGLIDREIFLAMLNRTYVWPTYQYFRALKDDRY